MAKGTDLIIIYKMVYLSVAISVTLKGVARYLSFGEKEGAYRTD